MRIILNPPQNVKNTSNLLKAKILGITIADVIPEYSGILRLFGKKFTRNLQGKKIHVKGKNSNFCVLH